MLSVSKLETLETSFISNEVELSDLVRYCPRCYDIYDVLCYNRP